MDPSGTKKRRSFGRLTWEAACHNDSEASQFYRPNYVMGGDSQAFLQEEIEKVSPYQRS